MWGAASFKRIHPVAFPKTLSGHRQPKSAISSLLRKFCCGGIFDFFNTIDPNQTWVLAG
jgi:hypothetical protein